MNQKHSVKQKHSIFHQKGKVDLAEFQDMQMRLNLLEGRMMHMESQKNGGIVEERKSSGLDV